MNDESLISRLAQVDVLLLDMNETFMFGADRFGSAYDYASTYRRLGGRFPAEKVNPWVTAAYDYLEMRYVEPQYAEAFPTVRQAMQACAPQAAVVDSDLNLLVDTFAIHELGVVPDNMIACLQTLSKRFRLGLVADIWSPKDRWVRQLTEAGVWSLFENAVFSSDWGIVKPSPRPFLESLRQMKITKERALMIGDSVRRDLGGARAAGLPCILVGSIPHPDAFAVIDGLHDLLPGESKVVPDGDAIRQFI